MTAPWPAHAPSIAPSPTAAAQNALQRMAATLAVARGLAASHRAVDLAGLDQVAGALCARLLDLEPQQGAVLRPALMELNEKVEALSQALRTQSPPRTK